MTPRTSYLMAVANGDVADFCQSLLANALTRTGLGGPDGPEPQSRLGPDGHHPISQEQLREAGAPNKPPATHS